ncbi:Rv1893 family protein [Mycobacterium sp. HM-7]
MPLSPRDSFDAVRDVAVHSVEKASDIVDNAADIIRGDVGEGISGIVHNSVDIGTHAVATVKSIITGNDADSDAEA